MQNLYTLISEGIKMYYRKVVLNYVKILTVLISAFIATVYVVDPYMVFHNNWIHPGKVHENFRIQSFGIINNYDFDSIIMGTSMLENTSGVEAAEKLGGTWVNLSMSGSSYFEKVTVLNYAIKNQDLKRVIFSLDWDFDKANHFENTFSEDLYTKSDFESRFNMYMNKFALKCIFGIADCRHVPDNFDRPNAWYAIKSLKMRFGGFENWKANISSSQIKQAFDILLSTGGLNAVRIAEYQAILDNYLVPMVTNNPDTKFEIMVPPYSLLWWSRYKADFDTVVLPYREIFANLLKYDNVNIYWFYDMDFVSDIAIYKDLTHYHQDINSLMIDSIQKGKNIISMENYEQKIRSFQLRVNKFDLDFYIKQIKEVYQKK